MAQSTCSSIAREVSAEVAASKKHPCILCQQRKVKCDRNEPCLNCTKANVACVPASAVPPRKRKRRFAEAELLARLHRYEEHLKKLGVDVDAINSESRPSNRTIKTEICPPSSDVAQASQDVPPQTLSIRNALRNVDNNLWTGISEEFREAEELLQGSEDDILYDTPITRTYDGISLDASDLLFGHTSHQSLASSHPSPVSVFKLWQTYLNNVNPLIKLVHAPTIQQQVLDASADLQNVPKSFEALLFGIYALAVASLNFEQCESILEREKTEALTHYQTALGKALQNAGFLRTSDIVVLQALVMFLHASMQLRVDPRSLFCLTGIAVRIGQRMGLQYDGSQYGLPPFPTELRRRVWWQIVLLDNRIAEISGAGTSSLTTTWNTKLPLNVNDSDLYPDMKENPIESQGLTEMLFVLLRYEVADMVRKSPPPRGSIKAQQETVDRLEVHLENKYLRHCNELIPLHLFSLLNARSMLLKVRMASYQPRPLISRNADLTEVEREKAFKMSIKMLEFHNQMVSTDSIRKLQWSTYKHFPFAGFVYMLCELRYRTSDDLADQAWRMIADSISHGVAHSATHSMSPPKDSPLRKSINNLTLKAWDAREVALRGVQTYVPIPDFIKDMREEMPPKRSSDRPLPTTNPWSMCEGIFGSQLDQLESESTMFQPSMDIDSMNCAFWGDLMNLDPAASASM